MAHALGIDVGTTNAKVALIGSDGTIAAAASRPITIDRDGPIAELDANALWGAVVEATREVAAAAPDAAADVTTVGVCSQYSSIVPVDAEGNPVAPMVTYLDRRGTDYSLAIMGEHPESLEVWIDRHGIPTVGGGLSLAHLLHLQRDEPDVHAKTAAYLEPMDFVNAQLTGRIAATQGTMFTSQLVDNRTLGVTEYDVDLIRMSGIDATRLPPLVSPEATVGSVTPAAAAALGIPAGVPVCAGINDSHAGAIATDAFRPGTIGVMIGTTSVMLDATAQHGTDLDHEVLSMPSPLAGRYLVWAENGLGGKALEHVLTHVVHAVDELGDHATPDEFARLDAAIASVPAGSGGVLFFPWLAGSVSPRSDGHVRGGFINLSLDTHRTDLVRAVVEGICHSLGWLLPVVEKFNDRPADSVIFGGGAARSPEWAQILADVLNRPVRTLQDPEQANARATALLAFHRLGVLSEPQLFGLVHTTREHTPNPAHRERYDAMQEQFVAGFEALRPIYAALNG